MTEPTAASHAESAALQRLRASLAAVNETRIEPFTFVNEHELLNRNAMTEARSLVLAEYTIYLLDRIEKLEARLADVPHT